MTFSLFNSEEDFFVSSSVSASALSTATATSASSFVVRSLQRIDPSMSNHNGESVFEYCSREALPLQCISDAFEQSQAHMASDANEWLLIFAAAMIFFMQAGFAMLCAGCVRVKNVGNTMLKNLLDACGAALGFFTVGYAFAFGGQDDTDATTFIGTTNFFMMNVENKSFWLFQFAFAATSTTIVAGTLAERCQMAAYLCYSVLITGFVYPVVAHSIWSRNGFLSSGNVDPLFGVGMVDFAGSAVVHITGGLTSIYATLILGPRKGRFYDARGNPLPKPKAFPGHSLALQMLGTFILWFGWYGFNPGSALTLVHSLESIHIASLAAVNTTLSAATAGVSALFTNLWYEERTTGEAKFDLICLMNGAITGLVAITAGCATVEPWAAVVTGLFAGWAYLLGSAALIRVRIDDAVDAIPVHLFGGILGCISTGLFSTPDRMMDAFGHSKHVGWFYELARGRFDANMLGAQICGILFVTGWVTFLMFPFFIWLNYMGWFRADSLEELVGLDISYHGGSALGNDEVKLEYIEAFNRRKGAKIESSRRHYGQGTETSMPQYPDTYSPHEAAALEGLDPEERDMMH